MRRLTVNTFLTLDGVMQAPGGPEEDRSGGFEFGGWVFPYWDDVMDQVLGHAMATPFDLLLGRKTYEIFAAHWPHITSDPTADALNGATKYVASRTLTKVAWANSILIEGDVASYVARLKQQDGREIQVHGSADLLQTLLRHNLIDELRLWAFPIVVGKGKRLFRDGATPGKLALVDAKTSSTGVVIATYRPSGAVQTGSFALEQPSEAEIQRREKAGR